VETPGSVGFSTIVFKPSPPPLDTGGANGLGVHGRSGRALDVVYSKHHTFVKRFFLQSAIANNAKVLRYPPVLRIEWVVEDKLRR